MKYNRNKFGLREAALAIAVVLMIYLTVTAFTLRSRILSKASEARELEGPEIIYSDPTHKSDPQKQRLSGNQITE